MELSDAEDDDVEFLQTTYSAERLDYNEELRKHVPEEYRSAKHAALNSVNLKK